MGLTAQVKGWLANVLALFSPSTLEASMPPSVWSTLVFVRDSVPRGLGFTNRRDHIAGVIALTIVMVVSSLGTLTYVAIVYFFLFMPVALLRLWPVVDKYWPFSEKSWPFWSVGGN